MHHYILRHFYPFALSANNEPLIGDQASGLAFDFSPDDVPDHRQPPVWLDQFLLPVEPWQPNKETKGMCRHITVASIDRKTKRLYPIPSIPRSKAPCGEMRDVCGGDVLVYNKFIDGMPLVLVVPYGLKIGSVDSDMCVLRINKNKLDPRFLYHIISTLGFTHQLTKREQVTIDIAQLSRVIVPLVPIMLQGKAVEILDRFERSSIRQYDAWVKSVNMLLYAQCEAYWCRTDLGPFFSALGKDRTKKR